MPWTSSQISSMLLPLTIEWIVSKLATPGRASGSYVTADVKSVIDFFTFAAMASGVSVIMMQLFGSGSDFDIFFVGSRSDLIRLLASSATIGSHIGKVLPNRLLKFFAKDCASWRCWSWSWPTGTCVALKVEKKFNENSFGDAFALTCTAWCRQLGEPGRDKVRVEFLSSSRTFLCIAGGESGEPLWWRSWGSSTTPNAPSPTTGGTKSPFSGRCRKLEATHISWDCSPATRLASAAMWWSGGRRCSRSRRFHYFVGQSSVGWLRGNCRCEDRRLAEFPKKPF